jgi:ribonuclease HII
VLYYERKFKKKGYEFIIGVDEAGRGPLAGPVVAAAVFLRDFRFQNRIDDSKKLTPREREKAFPEIINKSLFGIGVVSEKIIDKTNILLATQLAMKEAVLSLSAKLSHKRQDKICILIDGDVKIDCPFTLVNIIKGDAKSKSIASASILAKVTRDRMMLAYDKVYPEYGFFTHKGYPTKTHRDALKRIGPSPIHRMSFSL